MSFLSKTQYTDLVSSFLAANPLDKQGNPVGYWKDAADRWVYFEQIAQIVQSVSHGPQTALELGTMGISVFSNSDLMDYDKHLSYYKDGRLKYVHDARSIPWPVATRKYDWFIASRVFHHLWPAQRECFEEALRVAQNVILIVPESLPQGGGTPILPEHFRAWFNDQRPNIMMPVGRFGYLYAWFQGATWKS